MTWIAPVMRTFMTRLSPVGALALLRGGVYDVGLLALFALLILTLVLTPLLRKKQRKRVLWMLRGGAVALLLLVLLCPAPSLYIDRSAGQITRPSVPFCDALAAEPELSLTLIPGDSVDAQYVDALLYNAARQTGIRYLVERTDDEPGLLMSLGGRSGFLPLDRLFADNPLQEGEYRRVCILETELLTALNALPRDEGLMIYRLAGPQDADWPTVVFDAIRLLGDVTVHPLEVHSGVPKDASLLVIDDLRDDLQSEEAEALAAYLADGGRLLLLTGYAYAGMPNLGAVLHEFGLEPMDGVVLDSGSSMGGQSEYPVAQLGEHIVARTLGDAHRSVLMPLSHALAPSGATGALTHALLHTTDSAYLQLNAQAHASLERGSGDLSGPFNLAMAAQLGATRVVWIASADMASLSADRDVGGANTALLAASLRWLLEELPTPIPAKPVRSDAMQGQGQG